MGAFKNLAIEQLEIIETQFGIVYPTVHLIKLRNYLGHRMDRKRQSDLLKLADAALMDRKKVIMHAEQLPRGDQEELGHDLKVFLMAYPGYRQRCQSLQVALKTIKAFT